MVTNEQINVFLSEINEMLAATNEKNGYKWSTTVEAEFGRKYIRIVRVEMASRSAFCFVDASNGNILKSASWKVPAKGVRGNIANGAKDLTPYGAVYLR